MSSKNLKLDQGTEYESKISMPNKSSLEKKQMRFQLGNQTSQTKLVSLENCQAHINQLIKLNVNMYYDTTTSKFVQKKCLYDVLIITEKGSKTAGSITYDLAQFFNKRIYQIDQQFSLQKCPVEGTTLKMRIYYQQSTQAGYDSMSKITVIDNSGLDMSSVSMNELQSLNHNKSEANQKLSEVQTQKTNKGKDDFEDDKYSQLNESAVQQVPSSIKQKIQAVADVTSKIDEFVEKISTNLKYQIEGLKRKNHTIQQQVLLKNSQKQLITNQLAQLRTSQAQIKKQYNQFKDQTNIQITNLNKINQQLKLKLTQSQKLCNQLESNINQKGQSQANYIQQLKNNFQLRENELKKDINKLQQQIKLQKQIKNQIEQKNQQQVTQLKDLKEKYRLILQKNTLIEENSKKREIQLQKARLNLDKTYQKMIKMLGNII